MPRLVSIEWVQNHLHSPDVLVLDPRTAVQYLKGHLKNAVNLPVARRLLGPNSEVLPVQVLEEELGLVGLSLTRTPVIYDRADGRNGALLAWLLEYLGCTNVCFMDVFYEQWLSEGREIFYRPVESKPVKLRAQVRLDLRANADEIISGAHLKLLDVRSEDEFLGVDGIGDGGSHIPGAINLAWHLFNGSENALLAPKSELEKILASKGIGAEDEVVIYCHVGQRAALGYLALRHLSFNVRLFDGSYAEWVRRGFAGEQ